ncbi:MAG: hypothetical protein JO002_06930 [Burkholderiaceae bacterium]|nr:hypothetical protein [Burkholderiaceae bacterium]
MAGFVAERCVSLPWQKPMLTQNLNMACSQAFSDALAGIEMGRDARRASWPKGVVLRMRAAQIVMLWPVPGVQIDWGGPSLQDVQAIDWHIV